MSQKHTWNNPQRRWFPLLWLLLSWLPSVSLAQEIPDRESRLPVLTKIEQVRELTRQQAALNPEVCLRGVVTFYDPANLDSVHPGCDGGDLGEPGGGQSLT